MAEAMAAVGGDGFLITTPVQSTNRRTVIEVCDGLVPVLQRRGPGSHRVHGKDPERESRRVLARKIERRRDQEAEQQEPARLFH